MSQNLPNRIQREINKQNAKVGNKVDEIMQMVMADPEIHSRSDWDQIQKTLGLIVSSMTACDFSTPVDEIESIGGPNNSPANSELNQAESSR